MYAVHRNPTGTSAETGSPFASATTFSHPLAFPTTYRQPPARNADTIRLRGVDIHRLTEAGCVDRICRARSIGRGGTVVTPNLDHLRRCVTDPTFRSLVADAELVVADGMPHVWASRLQ